MLCTGISAKELDLDTSAHETMAEELASRSLDMPKRETPAPSISLVEPPAEKTVSLHVKDAPAADVLKGLAEMTGENVILSSHVKERVTASLDDVTPEEAMTSIMAACGLAGRKEGTTLIIFFRSIGERVRHLCEILPSFLCECQRSCRKPDGYGFQG